MTRRFGSRQHIPEPHNEELHSTHPEPSEGDPEHGIPPYPEPLPGIHDYRAPEPVEHVDLAVPPAKPYYSGGVAHGVKSPVKHGGRPTPHHHDRDFYRTEDEAFPEVGEYKPEPMPVYITESGAGRRILRVSFRQVGVVPGNDPVVLIPRSDTRQTAYLLNETALNTFGTELNPGNPAVASSFVYTNNTGVPQQITSIHAFLTADATVLNRFISVSVMDAAGKTLWSAVNGTATTASSTVAWNGYIGAAQQNSGSGTFTFPLPASGGLIPPGGTLTIGSGSYGAADQISNISLVFAGSSGGVRLKNGPDSETGTLLPAGQSRYFPLHTQDFVYAIADPSATTEQLVSIIEEYSVPR